MSDAVSLAFARAVLDISCPGRGPPNPASRQIWRKCDACLQHAVSFHFAERHDVGDQSTDAVSPEDQTDLRRADALRNRERILDAAERMLEHSPSATLGDIAAAGGVSRSTLHRRFRSRADLLDALGDRPHDTGLERSEHPLPTGRLGRERPVSLDAIQVFDVVPPAVLPEQLVAEAQRVAKPVALYVLDIDGTHLLHMAGPRRLGEKLEAPLAVGPELDADGLSDLASTWPPSRAPRSMPSGYADA